MFGLENRDQKKQSSEFVFDLENEIKDPEKGKKLIQKIQQRIQAIKQILRAGEKHPEDFEFIGQLLQGYNALLDVITRVNAKK